MEIRKLLEKQAVELLDSKPGAAHKAWPEVTYRGNNLFQTYIDGQDQIQRNVKSSDNQECYLGYSAKQDTFYCGFDTWPEDEDGDFHGMESEVVAFKIGQDGRVGDTSHFNTYENNFYGRGGGHRELEQDVSDIQDIRLD